MLAELLLGQPIFPGDSGVDQLVEIIKVLGTPTREQIREMNPNYTEFKFPQIKSHPWQKVRCVFFSFFKFFLLINSLAQPGQTKKKLSVSYTNFSDNQSCRSALYIAFNISNGESGLF